MEKMELLQYLDAVCNAENAICAIDEAIEETQKIRNAIQPMAKPLEPTPPEKGDIQPSYRKVPDGVKWFLYILGTVFLFFVFLNIVKNNTKGFRLWIPLIVPPIISVVATKMLIASIENGRKSASVNEQFSEAAEEFAVKWDYYQSGLSAYERDCVAVKLEKEKLNEEIAKMEDQKNSFLYNLNKLYQREVIYPTFRNVVAVNQIRDYLKMGMCEGLEGTYGAYSCYMEDVRTQRICGTLQEVKASIVRAIGMAAAQITSAISSSYQALTRELSMTNENISAMSGQITQRLGSIQQEVRAGSLATIAVADQIHSRLTRISDTIEASAHNQYVLQCQESVNRYLLVNPDTYKS